MSTRLQFHSLRTDQGDNISISLIVELCSVILCSISAIQDRNRQMIEARAYRDMHLYGSMKANFRYQLLRSDHSTLYRKFSRKLGVDVRQPPQYNIDEWLNPQSPNFQPIINEAVFHYSSRTEAGERFEVCISTPEMKNAAWEYVHHGQVVLDGTFGVCSSRLLLFIALGVDGDGNGVPIAFFLFSAPTGNRATHAGYNTAILQKLLHQWKTHLGQKNGLEFAPFVAITDTDTKERGALLNVWPEIILLLCKFHLRQCWTNNRKKALHGGGEEFWKNHVREQLRGLEVECVAFHQAMKLVTKKHYRLINSIDHNAAVAVLQRQQVYLAVISKNAASCNAALGGIKHLDYLTMNWMTLPMWRSWSGWGRLAAAAAMKVPIEGVIPTTNHLESFNAILKRKHLAAWLHSGHRLRFDLLIHILITRILPGIYGRRRTQQEYSNWLRSRFSDKIGGRALAAVHDQVMGEVRQGNSLCWWQPDAKRDQEAAGIVQLQRLTISRSSDSDAGFVATCASSKANILDPSHSRYSLHIRRSGVGACECLDFCNQGGACKHLRALRICIDCWVQSGVEMPFTFPTSLADAQQIQTRTYSTSPPTLPPTINSLQVMDCPNAGDLSMLQVLANDPTTVDQLEGSTPSESEESDSGPTGDSEADEFSVSGHVVISLGLRASD